jgi:hypothetical protein
MEVLVIEEAVSTVIVASMGRLYTIGSLSSAALP